MLKHIPKNISPDLLKTLMEMGHGDEIVLADANYPSASCANKLIRCDGVNIPELLDSILYLMPLDGYVDSSIQFMNVVSGDDIPKIWGTYRQMIEGHGTDLILEEKTFMNVVRKLMLLLLQEKLHFMLILSLRKE